MFCATMAERFQITGPDGRALDVEQSGPADGRVVLFHNGTPGAGVMFEPLVAAGAERGLRHITYSRPGYGSSARHEGRSVGDCTADVRAILDELGVERCVTVGVSGGGPHALACAALLPDRVHAAATIASIAPCPAEGLDWLDGMGEENVQEFAAAQEGGDRLHAFLKEQTAELLSADAEQLHAALGDLLSDVDSAVLTGDFAEYMLAVDRQALGHGVTGWFDDDVAFLSDWGFPLDTIEVPVTIWQGAQDRFVPFAHGQWLAAHVAGAQAELRPEHGHLSLAVGAYGDVLDDLLTRSGP
jgi:pimeloyl-ACP methyl ester carboxylesterase